MAQQHDRPGESMAPAHNHNCGGLFGCGDEKGTGVIREDIKEDAFDKRARIDSFTWTKWTRSGSTDS